jgi:hypothetical protein
VYVQIKLCGFDCHCVTVQEQPELIQLIKLSIEKSVNEWITPVIERAIKIAVTTCEQIVKKVSRSGLLLVTGLVNCMIDYFWNFV